MRIDPDTCRDPVLLSAEVRRLQAVITAGEPTLTDAEREAVDEVANFYGGLVDDARCQHISATLFGLLERLE